MTAVKYIHHTPGRLRIKGLHFNRQSETARRAVQALESLAGIEQIRLNPRAGSLTVHYQAARYSHSDLLAVLETTGCLHADKPVHTAAPARALQPREGVAGVFGKALVGAIAQRTATRLIGALL